MAWGKIIGGALGAVLGGPIGAGIGVAIGAGVDEYDSEASTANGHPTSGGDRNLIAVQTGNILQLTSAIYIPEDATEALVRIRQGGQLVKTFVKLFADDDEDFMIGKRITNRPLSLDVPLHVLTIKRHEPQAIEAIVVIIRDGEQLGYLSTPVWINVGFEPWRKIRWLAPAVDLLANYALGTGPWSSEKVQLIKATFEPFLESDEAEFEALRERLKLSVRPSVDECIASCHRRYDLDEFAGRLLFGVAGLLELSGWAEIGITSELDSLAGELKLAPELLFEVKRHFFSDEGESQHDASSHNKDVRWACEVLGVEMGAERDVVKQAYRKKISELHPDKYSNLPEVVQIMIKEKAQELNRARDILIKEGFS